MDVVVHRHSCSWQLELPAVVVTGLHKWPEKWGLGDQGWQGGGGEQCEHVVCKMSWVNSLYWLVIGKIFPLFKIKVGDAGCESCLECIQSVGIFFLTKKRKCCFILQSENYDL